MTTLTGWAEFALSLAAFFLSHSLPLRPAMRVRLVAVLGRAGFGLAYSALSLLVLIWLVVAAGRAPFVELWPRALWQNWAPLTAMVPVCMILALSLGRPNPFSFGGARNAAFDPERPGIVRWMRHPVLVAMALWSGAHIVPNGDLAHVILFGLFFLFSLFGMRIVDRRRRRLMGEDLWHEILSKARRQPVLRRPGAETLMRLCLGVGLYVALLFLHAPVIGVSPLP